jgi:serine/threonine-protein kinase RsbW
LEVPRKQPRSSLVALAERPCLTVVTVETTEIKLPSRIEAVAEASAAIAEVLIRSGVDDNAAFGIDMAVREAVTNAILHGNQQDETKFVEVTLSSSPAALEIKVHDQGPGFNPEAVPDPTKAENILKTSGRGIFFMRNFMDEVDWVIRPEGGTTVRMVKRL